MKTKLPALVLWPALSIIASLVLGCSSKQKPTEPVILYHNDFPSQWIESRNVEVWLPPDYDPNKEYDVLYMHDGQNVFNATTAYGGIAWEADSVMQSLLDKDLIRPAIVVGIWNSPKRFQEYMPNEPSDQIFALRKAAQSEEELLSDQYLKFIVEELKPFIDKEYSTKKEASSTFIMGSSMGGLISLYALMKYPDVFGGAGCISTHWPALDGIFLEYLPGNLPDPDTHKLYFDHGTINLDSLYHPFQARVDSIVEASGYTSGQNWITLTFEGHDHNEAFWRDRLHRPLTFLLGKDQE
ncbi:MAG: alpha/beta hydrolase-fold protein [Bacteroides sp.]|nr:alpha/beta hydrolase-fold protein [Bacteroides sp.]